MIGVPTGLKFHAAVGTAPIGCKEQGDTFTFGEVPAPRHDGTSSVRWVDDRST
jgi:hypothetical protein